MKKKKPIDLRLNELPENELLKILTIVCKERDILDLYPEPKKENVPETLLDGSHIFGATTAPLIDIPTTTKVSRTFLQRVLNILEAFDEEVVELGFTKDSPLMCKFQVDDNPKNVIYLYLAPRVDVK